MKTNISNKYIIEPIIKKIIIPFFTRKLISKKDNDIDKLAIINSILFIWTISFRASTSINWVIPNQKNNTISDQKNRKSVLIIEIIAIQKNTGAELSMYLLFMSLGFSNYLSKVIFNIKNHIKQT